MSINLMQGALAAVMLQQRKVTGDKLMAGAAFAAVMPGLPGLLLPVVMARNGAAPSNGDGASTGGVPVDTTPRRPASFVQVPPVEGMPVDLAKQAIEEANLVPEIVEDRNNRSSTQGAVYTQTPSANSYVEEKSTVELLVQVMPSVPAVKGLAVAKALELLKQAGLEARQFDVDTGGGLPVETIVTQNPKPGQYASDGKVTLFVQRPEGATGDCSSQG